jgi:hypothetical protein
VIIRLLLTADNGSETDFIGHTQASQQANPLYDQANDGLTRASLVQGFLIAASASGASTWPSSAAGVPLRQ